MQPRPCPGLLLLCPKIPIFPPLQPDHTGCDGDLQLCHVDDPGLGEPLPSIIVGRSLVSSERLVCNGGDPQAIGPERQLQGRVGCKTESGQYAVVDYQLQERFKRNSSL
jgi:hypothetical protein